MYICFVTSTCLFVIAIITPFLLFSSLLFLLCYDSYYYYHYFAMVLVFAILTLFSLLYQSSELIFTLVAIHLLLQ